MRNAMLVLHIGTDTDMGVTNKCVHFITQECQITKRNKRKSDYIISQSVMVDHEVKKKDTSCIFWVGSKVKAGEWG